MIRFSAVAQNKHCRVFLTDKGPQSITGNNVPPDFTDAAIQRRMNLQIPWTTEDWPVYEPYVQEIEKHVIILFKSRWFNMLSAELNDSALRLLSDLPFVSEISCFENINQGFIPASFGLDRLEDDNTFDKELMAQTEHLEAEVFRGLGLNGRGVRIAVLDIGFKDLPITRVLKGTHVIEARDFMSKKSKVYSYHDHGTQVMSCLAGTYNKHFLGLAPEASYLLARTERNGEYMIEEESWIEAAEWADRMGARIISSSLGYTWQRYWRKDMDGKTSLVSRGAATATSKGILVVCSAGNEGDGDWRIIGAPADSDSVLSVGGVDPSTGFHVGFSSFGPNMQGNTKPNVCAYGKVFTGSSDTISRSEGTSFSCPLISGFAACLIQSDSSLTPYQLRKRIEASGHLYPYFDYAHGFGVPKASRALYQGDGSSSDSCLLSIKEDDLGWRFQVSLKGNEVNDMNPNHPSNHLYYHVEQPGGGLAHYRVVFPFQMYLTDDELIEYREPPLTPLNTEIDALFIPKKGLMPHSVIRAVYRGCFLSLSIND